MLTVQDVISAAAVGELSMHKLGEDGATTENIDQWLTLLNIALNELYTRFPLKLGDTYIKQEDNITRYELASKYAQTNTGSTEPVKYIHDTAENPFNPRFMRIESVWNEWGEEIAINNEDDCKSYFTPQYNVLQIPDPSADLTVNVVYRVPHTKLVEGTSLQDTLDIELELPVQFLKCLTAYIGYTAYNSMGSEQGIMGLNYRSLYKAACDEIEAEGLHIQSNKAGSSLCNRGWV